jgi:short-subunit dehydrogenase
MVAYGDALRGSLHADKIKVSVIMPGYIRTPLTDKNNFSMPLLMEPQKAAEKIIIGLSRNKRRIIFPKVLYFILKVVAFVPVCLTDPILRKLPRK